MKNVAIIVLLLVSASAEGAILGRHVVRSKAVAKTTVMQQSCGLRGCSPLGLRRSCVVVAGAVRCTP